ncbi:uncharacterized protein [Physcomitrium patens]|uniref:uncharacterized protein n=1 Tax=Physcomitrium patens TaxID=3218 RepID=UPI000D1769E4|nr:uncharacterized protein LOC112274585 [Physcomitrium patens]|eukprot:XP_024360023.1 uncharacterized protein LOC112274585 [Physcomitrella patens]
MEFYVVAFIRMKHALYWKDVIWIVVVDILQATAQHAKFYRRDIGGRHCLRMLTSLHVVVTRASELVVLRVHPRCRMDWDTKLFAALWAYRTVYKLTTNVTPFKLVYGQEAILRIEFEVQSLRIALEERLGDTESLQVRFAQLEQLDETRTNALLRQEATQRRQKRKFHIRWHGLYRVIEGFPNGSVQLEDFMGAKFTMRINGNRLHLYTT